MKIRELFEQTIAPIPPGQNGPLPPTGPTEPGPGTSNTPNVQQPAGTPKPTLGNQQPGLAPANSNGTAVDAGQAQQMQQASKDSMSDLDKIAAQIVGLKQKQLQMQQQIPPTQ